MSGRRAGDELGDEPGGRAGETSWGNNVLLHCVCLPSAFMVSVHVLPPCTRPPDLPYLFPIPVTYPELKLNPVSVSSLPLPCPVSYPEKDQHFSCLVLSSVRLACLVIHPAVSERSCCCRNHERQSCFVPCVVVCNRYVGNHFTCPAIRRLCAFWIGI